MRRVTQALRGLLILLAAAAMIAFVLIARRRFHSPYEYDWIEDGMLAGVRHICAGLPLYAAPSIHFTPYLYTPIYLYLSAALAKVTGITYVPLRALSIAATCGSFAAIIALVFSETRRYFAAIAGAGLFAACYAAVDGSFDVGRVDMLYIFFVLCALYATRRMSPWFAALLWVCAFQTKQGVLPIALLMLCHQWPQPRRVLAGLASFAVLLGASIAVLNRMTHGWYRYYVFGMSGGFGLQPHKLMEFFRFDMAGVCGAALIVIVAATVLLYPRWRHVIRGTTFSFYALGTVGMIFYTGYIRAHRGANTNSLIPAYAWIAVLFGVALGKLYQRLAAQQSRWAQSALAILLLAAGAQFAQLHYSFDDWAPSADEAALRENFEARLRRIPGEVMVFSHPEYALAAGKQEYADSEAVGEVIEAKQQENGDRLMEDYAALVHSRRLSAIVLDRTAENFQALPRTWIPRDFLAYYPVRIEDAGGSARRFTSQPKYIYLQCPSPGAVDVPRLLDAAADESGCAQH